MAKISNTTTYPTKATPVSADYVIGTDASSKETKTFTLQSIANLYGGSGSGTVTSVGLDGGTTGLTIASDTVNPITANGTFTLGGTLGVANGGTGLTSLAEGSIIIGDSSSSISALSIGTDTYVLTSNGTTASWAAAASGGGITFSGSTTNGLATYSNSATANVSSVFTVLGDKLSAPAGTLANPSIEVGTVGGLYAASGGLLLAHNGANAIGVSSASVVNYKLTQFNAGLKFGSAGSTLDTYTEATWSGGPTVSFSVGGSASLSTSSGSYRVIGDMVFAYFSLTFGSGSIGYGSVDISLPVSGLAGTGSINFSKMNSNVGNSPVSTPVTGDILTNSSNIRLKSFNYDQDSGSHVSGQLFELVDSAGQPIFQNGDIVSGTIIYRKQ